MTTTAQNGIGAGIAVAINGTTAVVRWAPDLVVTIDTQPIAGVSEVEVDSQGAWWWSSDQTYARIIFTFQGDKGRKTATVVRLCSALAATTTNDGFIATMESATS